MGVLYFESELYHYGVKGMKWGVRKDQKYSGRKLKASRTKEMLKRAGRTTFDIAVAYFLPGVNTLRYATSVTKDTISSGTDYMKKEGDPEKVSKMKKMSPESPDESIHKINISKGHKIGTYRNCASCAMAMDMRSRGYDVRARRQGDGIVVDDIASIYGSKSVLVNDNRRASPQEVYDKTCDAIAKDNKGNSSGVLALVWKHGEGGHAIYYKSKNGDVEFYDGQVAKSGSKIDSYFVNVEPTGVSYVRTDNHKPSDEVGYYVVSREGNNEKSKR